MEDVYLVSAVRSAVGRGKKDGGLASVHPVELSAQMMRAAISEEIIPALQMDRAELEAFAAAIAGTHPFPVSVEEAVHGVGVLEAVGRSAETGRTISIS